MNNTPSISLVCILYYSSHLVDTFLENIIKKIGSSLRQIIFVNNSSERIDITMQKNEYYPKDIVIINNDSNIGYGAALNLGVSYAKYSTLILCNPDIQIIEFSWPLGINKYRHFFLSGVINNTFRVNKPPDLFYMLIDIGLLRMYGKLLYPFLLFRCKTKISPDKDLSQTEWFAGCFIITNKESFRELDSFDEKYFLFFEETDLFQRAKLHNIPLFITNKIKVQTQNDKASNINVDSIKKRAEAESMLRYVNKYYRPIKVKLFMNALKSIVFLNVCILRIITHMLHSKKAVIKKGYYILLLKILKDN